jgi:hypothetical protein
VEKIVERFAICVGILLAPSGQAVSGTVIPSVFEAGHIYATPHLVNGLTIRLIVDTGGGGAWTYWLGEWSPAAKNLTKLPPCKIGGDEVEQFRPPDLIEPSVPAPTGPCVGITIQPQSEEIPTIDGMLGANYLASHGIWTFDYPAQQLVLEDRNWMPDGTARRAPLGFQSTPIGLRRGFPRLTMSVEGKPIEMLLDTGATAQPTAETLAATKQALANHQGVTSYITKSMFNQWHRSNPDWTVIEKGDDLFGSQQTSRVIRVPEIRWAGFRMGPVWFTERANANFYGQMADQMDRRPEGALGANVFQHLKLTIDYSGDAAWITCNDRAFCKSD